MSRQLKMRQVLESLLLSDDNIGLPNQYFGLGVLMVLYSLLMVITVQDSSKLPNISSFDIGFVNLVTLLLGWLIVLAGFTDALTEYFQLPKKQIMQYLNVTNKQYVESIFLTSISVSSGMFMLECDDMLYDHYPYTILLLFLPLIVSSVLPNVSFLPICSSWIICFCITLTRESSSLIGNDSHKTIVLGIVSALSFVTAIENKKIKYCEKTLSSERLNFFIEDLIKLDYIQDLICDSSIIDICKNYFQHTPVFAEVNMWWSIVNQNKSSSEAAQLYHFDLDATKWLKIFIYLTDVDLKGGPHCYVSGTHINDDSSKKLLSKGYVRISDKEMGENYSPNKFNTILGPRGTIVFGDTRAFHKGLKPIKNDRLILELTYINSNFLYEFNKIKLSPLDIKSHTLKNNIKHSSIFQNIKLI